MCLGIGGPLLAAAFSAVTDKDILRIQGEIQQGHVAQAEREIAAALTSDPRNGGLYNLRGIIQAGRNQLSPALADFARAMQLSPQLVGASLNYGRACEMLSRQDPACVAHAIAAYQRVLAAQPGLDDVRVQLAKFLASRGDYAPALSELDRLSQAARNQEPAVSLRKQLQSRTAGQAETGSQLADERRQMEALAARQPNDVAPLLTLAHLAQKQNDLQGALGYLAHARALKPKDPAIHFFFGVVCIELNLPLEAKKSLDAALQIDPSNAAYNYARGSVELQGNSAWLAIPYFKKFIAAQPADPRGHFALAVAQFASHDYEAAQAELTGIAGKPETAAGVQYFLGRIAKVNGDWESAAAHLSKSVALEPGFAESHAELGLARMHLGDLTGARAEIDRALQISPDSYLANGNLLALYQRTKDPSVAAQQQKLNRLDARRSEKQELMVRTIRIAPPVE